MSKKEAAFYKKLEITLNETLVFPADYMFKFIIPNQLEQKQQIETIFDFVGAVIKSNPSKAGNYLSITVIIKAKSAIQIIEKYKEVAKVKGVISL
ncbi:MAG: DUF493 domain-containing protein [Flavobacteriales bacterium]|jgi:uncharacterized protein|nr:DUF493 domain-containing protein [Flavobacteriales bacterium]